MTEKKETKKGYHNDTDYKKEALKAAKELLYGPDIIQRIKMAKSDFEIGAILTEARKNRK